MKCPYCVGEIDDQAVACVHCSRDLFFLRPLLERLGVLEARLKKAEASLSHVAQAAAALGSADAKPAPRDSAFHLAYLTVLIAAGIVGAGSFAGYRSYGASWMLWISFMVPFPAGFILGFWWPGRHLLAYVWAGLLLGVVNFAALLQTRGSLGPGWEREALVGVLAVAAVFVSGGEIGDWIECRFKPHPAPSPFALRWAERLVTAEAGDARDSRTQRLAELITAVQPLVPVAAALIGVWAQYASRK